MIDLVAIAKPLEDVKFPNGTVHKPRPLDAAGYELVYAYEATADHMRAATPGSPERVRLAGQAYDEGVALLKWVFQSATDRDMSSLGSEDVEKLVMYAARKIRLVETELKNAPSGDGKPTETPAPDSPPSSPIIQ